MKQETSMLMSSGMTKCILYHSEELIVEVEDLFTIEDPEEPYSPYYSGDTVEDHVSQNESFNEPQKELFLESNSNRKEVVICSPDQTEFSSSGISLDDNFVIDEAQKASLVIDSYRSMHYDFSKCDVFEPETMIIESEEPIHIEDTSEDHNITGYNPVEEISDYSLRFIISDSQSETASQMITSESDQEQTTRYEIASFACIVCGRSFDSERKLNSHGRTHRKPQTCSICQKMFSQQLFLKRHIRSDHLSDRPHHCHLCLSSFVLRASLQVHMKGVHLNQKPHQCNQCEKTFAARQKLRWHILSHTGEKPFQCPVCLNNYARSDHMRRHLRTAHKQEEPDIVCLS